MNRTTEQRVLEAHRPDGVSRGAFCPSEHLCLDFPSPVLAQKLEHFEPIGLAELGPVTLLDRTDTKYVLRQDQLLEQLPSLCAGYRILEINSRRLSAYHTLYFDTTDYALYRQHHSGRRTRYKVRSREYVETGQSYLEIKRKLGADRTQKERLATPQMTTLLTSEALAFVTHRLPWLRSPLAPRVWNRFVRVTLVSRERPERLTLDFALRFWGDGRCIALPGVVTAEVKYVGRHHASDYIQVMRQQGIRPTGFSKYCIGASLLNAELKYNRFKPHLRLLQKLQQGGSA